MKHRLVIYGGTVPALAAVVAILATAGPHEPRHDGRRLSEWIHEATEGPEEQRQRAIDAMLAMEPELFSWLVKMTGARDTRLTTWWAHSPIRQRWLGGRFQPRLAQTDRDKALLAFQALGPSATPAVPLLERLLNQSDTSANAADALHAIRRETAPVFARALTNESVRVRSNAARHLGLLGTEGRPALPELVACLLHSTNSEPRAIAAWSMGQIARGFPSTEQSQSMTNELASLIACLAESDAEVRAASVEALCFFGTNAQSAASTLRRLRTGDPDDRVRKSAEMALSKSGSPVGRDGRPGLSAP